MRYISMFSGVEAASLAWGPLGWEPVAFCEIDPFPCAVLKERFPDVPNLGDVSKVDWSPYVGSVDLVVGGSPCQSFSIAGKREGLDGASGLMWEFCRAVADLNPRWFVWENVPGALSSSGGEDLRCLLNFMDEHGFSMCGRVLDSQYFGVAQRRRRFFLVGRSGANAAGKACAVLIERNCLRWNNPSSREKRQELAARAGCGPAKCHTFVDRCGKSGGGKGVLMQDELASTLNTCAPPTLVHENGTEEGSEASDEGCMTPWDHQTMRVYGSDGAWPTLSANAGKAGQNRQSVCYPINTMIATRGNKLGERTAFGIGEDDDPQYTLSTAHEHAVCYSIDGTIARGARMGQNGKGWSDDGASPMLNTMDIHAIAHALPFNTTNITSPTNGNNPQWDDPCHTLAAQDHPPAVVTQYGEEVAGTLTARGDSSPCADRGQNIVCFKQNASDECRAVEGDGDIAGSLTAQSSVSRQNIICMADVTSNASIEEDMCGTLTAHTGKEAPIVASNGDEIVGSLCARDYKGVGSQYVDEGKVVSDGYVVRRLTPLECERLQGFPDGWTDLTGCEVTQDLVRAIAGSDDESDLKAAKRKASAWSKKCPDSPRYKACGNSMAVPVMRWIGERIALVDELFGEEGK